MDIKKYHLHKGNYTRLHFQMHDSANYCHKNLEHCYKAHQHSFYQLIWFKEKGQHYIDYERMEHAANTLFFINKNQIHYFCTEVSNEGILFHFDELFLNQQDLNSENWLEYKLFNEIGLPYVLFSQEEVDELNGLVQLLAKELSTENYNYRQQAFHLLQLILLKVERLKQDYQPKKKDPNFVVAIDFKRLITANMDKFLSIDDYAGLLGVSNKKLTRITKHYLKNTPAVIVHQRKILEAKRKLSNHNTSIKEVAYLLGFSEPTYFTKYFKKHTGFTPKSFVQQLL